MSSAKTWPDSGFKFGDPVRTIAVQNPPTDWSPDAVRSRRFGVAGVVIGFHDSHGICFDVRHEDDGTIGCYDARELAPLPLGAPGPLKMPSAAEMGISVRLAAPRPQDRVRTVAVLNSPVHWPPEAAANRRFGVEGTVVGPYNHHGDIFDVRHDDGTCAPYAAVELLPLARPPQHRHLRVRVRDGSLVVIEEKEPGVWTTIMAGPADCSFFDVMLPADEPLRFGTWAAPPPAALKGPGI